MNRNVGAVVVMLLYLAEPMPSEAASFDCAKSTTNVEELVCEDRQLSYLDEKLNLIYRASSRKSSRKDDLKQKQRKWLEERGACQDIGCLQKTYSSRISELAVSLDTARNRSDENKTCNTVAEYANRGELSKLYVEVDKSVFPVIQKYFGDLSHATGYWFVDLDNDGVQDPVVIETAGTGHYASVVAKSSRYLNVTIGPESDDQKDEFDFSFIAVLGKHYVLSRNEDKLIRLWHVAKGNFSPFCEFQQRENPNIQVLNGDNSPVCQAVLSGKVNYVVFTPMSYFLNDYDILKGEVMADITNTGHQSKVSLVNMLIPGGRGCSWLEIKVEDEKNPEQLNPVTRKSAYPCDSKQNLFVLNGKTYIGERTTSPHLE